MDASGRLITRDKTTNKTTLSFGSLSCSKSKSSGPSQGLCTGRVERHLKRSLSGCLFGLVVSLSLVSVPQRAVAQPSSLAGSTPGLSASSAPYLSLTGAFRSLRRILTVYAGLVSGQFPDVALPESLSIEDLFINPWRSPDDLRIEVATKGDPIPPYESVDTRIHVVTGRQTWTRLADMYKYPKGVLEWLNPHLDPENLHPGDRVLVWQRSNFDSESRRRANGGSLRYGEPLIESPAYRMLYPHRDFGTTHTVAVVQSVLTRYMKQYPGSYPLLIGDISFRPGRRIQPHRSHQSGRDIDIAYPNIKPPASTRRFKTTTRKTIDSEKALWLLKAFVDSGYVEYIFMDRGLQKVVREEALRQGAPEEWVQSVFHYRGHPHALIRHSSGHRNHFHVRFRCWLHDRTCRDTFDRKGVFARRFEVDEEEYETEEDVSSIVFAAEEADEIVE